MEFVGSDGMNPIAERLELRERWRLLRLHVLMIQGCQGIGRNAIESGVAQFGGAGVLANRRYAKAETRES